MSKDWAADIHHMHEKYGFHSKVAELSREALRTMLTFRLDFLTEELREAYDASDDGHSDDVVDAMIDLCVVAIGTLDLYGVDCYEAWDRVHAANMSKRVGIKASRPNPLGLPDLIKPEGWVGPEHKDNVGTLKETLE